MKKFLFLLISIFILNAYSEAEDSSENKDSMELDTSKTLKKDDKDKKGLTLDTSETFKKDDKDKKGLTLDTSETFKKDGDKKLEFDSSTTLKRDGDKKLEFDSESTFKDANKQSTADIAKKIKETIQKDPKKAELLTAKIKEIQKLLKEAKKYKATGTVKACSKAAASLKILADFHNGKKVSDKKLYDAYNNSKNIEKDIKKIKLRIESAKRNTPQAIKIRKFQFAAKNDLEEAEKAKKRGKKALAEYYKTCAEIKQNAAKNYAKNPKIEETSKQQIKKAIAKYNYDYSLETAARFRQRAKECRDIGDEEKTKYYEKAVELKEKLAKAYAKGDKSLIRSIKKEYQALQNTRY